MYALTIIVAALGLATASPTSDFSPRQVAAVASVDRYAGAGCRGTICNKAGSGDLHAGCNAITDACQASLRLNYANAGCKVAIWTDATCTSVNQFANVTITGECYALGPPIKGISVTC
ncbi:uncharacterized protein J4E88_005870 [Alternaria novae-zelandiae]|uniref:uncharacterized protein n=1 Tax=Alternaria novae-zelandiae TaxID=430562 RepID=UPI0020C1BE4F|nr:uncharacterized protein J4E88_005870 [Alternaria novae-zelandiae]KAI4679980.1 hypothetical protein J4E88_005870 [Alternaria novae-zelandiae]